MLRRRIKFYYKPIQILKEQKEILKLVEEQREAINKLREYSETLQHLSKNGGEH